MEVAPDLCDDVTPCALQARLPPPTEKATEELESPVVSDAVSTKASAVAGESLEDPEVSVDGGSFHSVHSEIGMTSATTSPRHSQPRDSAIKQAVDTEAFVRHMRSNSNLSERWRSQLGAVLRAASNPDKQQEFSDGAEESSWASSCASSRASSRESSSSEGGCASASAEALAAMARQTNPLVFFDVEIDGGSVGRIEMELRADVVPLTAENFRCLCTGERGTGAWCKKSLHYKRTKFHRIVTGYCCQGGDFALGTGMGSESIFAGNRGLFQDENFSLKHDGPGVLSMANQGPNTNGSQFLLSSRKCKELDGRHVVFGRVVNGMDVVAQIDEVGSSSGSPSTLAIIEDCGELIKP